MSFENALNQAASTVPECVAAGYVDISSGMLLALKTLEMHARRDAMVVFFLGFFALLANFLHSQSLLTALAIAIGLVGLLTALVNAHMPVGQPSLRFAAGLSLKMIAIGAPLTLALFVFFPRMAPLWGVPMSNSAKTGLSDEMNVGNMASLAQDQGIAFRVLFNTEGNRPPPSRQLYWRGPVLADFDGRTWRASGGTPSPSDKPLNDISTSGDPFAAPATASTLSSDMDTSARMIWVSACRWPPSPRRHASTARTGTLPAPRPAWAMAVSPCKAATHPPRRPWRARPRCTACAPATSTAPWTASPCKAT